MPDQHPMSLEQRIVHCWEDGSDYGWPSHTCMALDGHEGSHDWIPDDEIRIDFK